MRQRRKLPGHAEEFQSTLVNQFFNKAVAYPELVSRGVSKSRKCKRLVKGASTGVTPLIEKNHGRGGFPGNQKTTLDTPL